MRDESAGKLGGERIVFGPNGGGGDGEIMEDPHDQACLN
eukprot:COSAG02_NODE_1829_length_10738_cov_4.595827_11_plen_39_part_00